MFHGISFLVKQLTLSTGKRISTLIFRYEPAGKINYQVRITDAAQQISGLHLPGSYTGVNFWEEADVKQIKVSG